MRAYGEVEAVHDLPAAHHYWANRYVTPLFCELEFSGLSDFWMRMVREQCQRVAPRSARLVSLGSGNGETEIPLAAALAKQGIENLEVVLVELNVAMLERAVAGASDLGIDDRVRVVDADLNRWRAQEPADIYMAIHSLHHVVELEHLYDQISTSLSQDGVFLVNDMIGRNGHVRWPEAADLLRRIWDSAPERYKYNHYLGRIDTSYPDIDCSGEGFEGVRAQDVLPLLLERLYPEYIFGFGNLTDPFIDRIYGPNFDLSDRGDTEFLDAVACLDDSAIDLGILTPTHLIGSFRSHEVPCRFPRTRSPRRIVRNPHRDSAPAIATVVAPDIGRAASEGVVTALEEQVARLCAELELTSQRFAALRDRKIVQLGLALADSRHKLARAVRRAGRSGR